MQEKEIIGRIKTICAARSWSFYRLAKESGITYSTLCTMLHKANVPSLPTLIKICNGFGITLAQFFEESDERALLTAEEKQHLAQWNALTAQNQAATESYIRFLLSQQNLRDS